MSTKPTPYRRIPKKFYKYLPLEFASRIVEHGELLIGTLDGYRDVEKFGLVIGDGTENSTTYYDAPRHLSSNDLANWSPLARSTVANIENAGGDLNFSDCVFSEVRQGPDCWVYCVSDTPSKAIATDFNADVCVRIHSINFFDRLWDALRPQRHASHPRFGPCWYTEKWIHWQDEDGTPPEFQKDPQYSNQFEWRLAWNSPQKTIGPFVIRVPELSQFCELLDLDDLRRLARTEHPSREVLYQANHPTSDLEGRRNLSTEYRHVRPLHDKQVRQSSHANQLPRSARKGKLK